MKSDAFITGLYRYELRRDWSAEPSPNGGVCWIMLNPSTAAGVDAQGKPINDPTIRKCIGFTERLGHKALTVVNLFAYRATDPKQLAVQRKAGVDIVGPSNSTFIYNAAMRASLVICAWGAYDGVDVRAREQAVWDLIPKTKPLWCLGVSKRGRPRHPLMLSYETTLIPWSFR